MPGKNKKSGNKRNEDVSIDEELGPYIPDITVRKDTSVFGKRKDKDGRTVFLDHLVINGKSRIKHYGIHGVRGWRNNEVQFKVDDYDTEFLVIHEYSVLNKWAFKPRKQKPYKKRKKK